MQLCNFLCVIRDTQKPTLLCRASTQSTCKAKLPPCSKTGVPLRTTATLGCLNPSWWQQLPKASYKEEVSLETQPKLLARTRQVVAAVGFAE